MSESSQALPIVLQTLVLVGVMLWLTRRGRGMQPPAGAAPEPVETAPQEPESQGEPPMSDPLRLHVYILEQALRNGPDVAMPDELELLPAFRQLLALLARPEFTDADLEAYACGERAYPAWAALRVLATRPVNEAIAVRAYHWLNQFHPWSREFTLRLLEAWYPDDAALVGRVLVHLRRGWCNDTGTTMTLDRFLRRRAAAAALSFHGALAGLDGEARDFLGYVLGECEETLARPLLAELRVSAPAPAGAPATAAPTPASSDHAGAGRLHAAGEFAMPVLYPRAALSLAYERLLRALRAEPRRSVLVTGDPGVGKTTLARSLAAAMSKDGWRVFETSALELNAGMSYVGQLEGRIQALLQEVRREPKTLWLVRDFQQLLYTGSTNSNPTGALDLLQPALESGELVVIGEARALAADVLLTQRPELARQMDVVRLDAPRDEELEPVAEAWLAQLPAAELARVPAELAEEAVALARHHLAALGMPAGVIRVLERTRETATAEGADGAMTLDRLLRALSELTGLPADLLDDRKALDTTALRAHFASRVLGQPEAVRVLVERLALMKAGIASPSRPYAVFLFAGPTGTGKTELVKALAAWLFGSAERLVRVDMSELQDSGAMDRMLAAGGLAAGGSLAARVRRQPFSVVLLDEFEKAHPRVWDLFLQVFDDGRLTDSRGDTVDFRNTFIVLTSNLGSKLQGGERLGFVGGQEFSAREVERAVGQAFRPELLNRLDRIVVFQPLAREVMRDILRKQIHEAFERRGLRNRAWAVEIEESAIEFLLQRGFTADLGARPLQRALEQFLLAPLARTIVERRAPEGDQFLFVRADGDHLAVEFVDPDAPDGTPAALAAGRTGLRAIAWESHGEAAELEELRVALAELEAKLADPAWSETKSARLAETGQAGFWQRPDRFDVLGRAEYMDRVESGLRSARSLLARLEGESRARASFPRPLLRRLAQQLLLLATAADEALASGPRDAFVALEPGPDAGDDAAARAWRDRLVTMYQGWARARGMRVTELDAGRGPGARPADARWLAVSGFGSLATLEPEEGLHLFEQGTPASGGGRVSVRVRVVAQPPRPARGPEELARQAAETLGAGAGAPPIVRRYRETPSPLVRDLVRGWRTGRVERVLAGDFDVVPAGEDGEGAA